MRFRGVVAGALAVSIAATAAGGAARAAERGNPVRDAVTTLVTRGGFPAAVAYHRDGDRVSRYAAGVADVRTGEPARAGQRWRIASNTKGFVAVVVLQLAAEGRLSLDAPVAVPGVPAVTPRQLLGHTSGIHDPADAELFAPYFAGDRGYVYTPDEVIRMALRKPPSAPGRYEYSNTGYLVLGKLVEAVTGHDVRREVAARVLRPLGLVHTSFPLTSPRLTGPHLHGYDLARVDWTTISPSYDWTAGAMVSTVDDLATFHRALFAGRLLPPELQAQLIGQGLGVEKVELPCGRTVRGGSGAGPGYVSMSVTDGRRQLTLVATVFDVKADAEHRPPLPSRAGAPLVAAFC